MKKQVIEYAGVPVGIVIPDEDRLKFIAVKFHVHDLDEQRFGGRRSWWRRRARRWSPRS